MVTARGVLVCVEPQQHSDGAVTLSDGVLEFLDGNLEFHDGGNVLLVKLLGLALQFLETSDKLLVTFRNVTELLQTLLVLLKEDIVEDRNQITTEVLDEHAQYQIGDKEVFLCSSFSVKEDKIVLVGLAGGL